MTSTATELGAITSATRNAVEQNTANAKVVFTASAVGHGAVASTITLGSFAVEVDEPPVLGGTAAAPNPVEYYLASLLSCHVVTYRFGRIGSVSLSTASPPRRKVTWMFGASSGLTRPCAPASLR